jgi:NDP-sugar pyrophosphorylase family protein
MTIVIPMAGMSRRFKEAGYTLPKYMLYAYNRSLFNLSISSFKRYFENVNFIFIIRDIFSSEEFIHAECKLLGIQNYQITCLDSPTRGQAETVYIGLKKAGLSSDEAILIFNIDTFRPEFLLPSYISSWDGYLEVFKGSGKNWSYAKVIPGTTQVSETAEKKEISDNCSTGLYYFKETILYYTAYEYYENNNLNVNEFYVAPLYNYLIEQNKNIHIDVISAQDVIFCGTPEEYISYLKSL